MNTPDCCCRRLRWWTIVIIIFIACFFVIATELGYKPLPPELGFAGVSSSVGYPVWSSTSNNTNSKIDRSIAGIEKRWNEGFIWPPLQGLIGRVNPRFTVFTQMGEDSSTRIDIVKFKNHANSLFYMESAGYIVVNLLQQPRELRSSTIVNVHDGKKRTHDLLSNVGLGKERGSYIGIPSRDGNFIAAMAWDEMDLAFSILNVSSLDPVFEPSIVSINKAEVTPYMFWDINKSNEEPTFIFVNITDTSEEHIRIGIDGTINRTNAKLVCTPYPTSSGRISSDDGAFLTVNVPLNSIQISYLDQWNNCSSIYFP